MIVAGKEGKQVLCNRVADERRSGDDSGDSGDGSDTSGASPNPLLSATLIVASLGLSSVAIQWL